MIIFNENRSFDHYFATYPNAANPSGSIPFVPKPHTPRVNNLANANLLVNNPNNNPANGTGATDPFRLDRTQANTRSQNHSYTPEQQAVDNGKDDLFPKFTGRGTAGGAGAFGTNGQVMGYFDGNTVTALLELRPALRHERQQLDRHLRSVDAGHAGSRRRPDQRRAARHRHHVLDRRTARAA